MLSGGLRPNSGISPDYFGLSRTKASDLALDSVSLASLIENRSSPLHVVNVARLRDNARRFLNQHPDLPAGCEVFYSYKTNPVPGVLLELHQAGIGAEVISHYELWLALELGVPPSKIVYNGPAKSEASIRLAIEQGVELLNLNHPEEIAVVSQVAARVGRKARVGLRVSLDGWAGQFGTAAAGDRALRAYETALRSPWLEVVGLHVHRGGMLRSETELAQFVEGVLAFATTLREKLGLDLEILDLGGSLGARSVRGLTTRELRLNRTFFRELDPPDPAENLSIEAYTKFVLTRVQAHYALHNKKPPRVFLEPGRALTSDAQFLLTRVLSLKEDGERTFAILDAGINVAESCRSEYHQVLTLKDAVDRPLKCYTLVGPICTPGDTLRWAVRLPQLEVGDTLAIMDSGAYFVPFSTSFSFPRPGIVAVENGQVRELRRAETFDDLTVLDEPSGARRKRVDSPAG